jgi:hypothetical protein
MRRLVRLKLKSLEIYQIIKAFKKLAAQYLMGILICIIVI